MYWTIGLILISLISNLAASAAVYGEAGIQQSIVRFREDLNVRPDIRLEGNHASIAVPLPLGRLRGPVESASLHLFLEHAPTLDENRSFLTITVNYGIVRSLRLDRQNISSTGNVISIPPELFRKNNDIVFSAEQYSTGEAWTAISARSFFVIDHKRIPVALDVSELPFTFMDDPNQDRVSRIAVFRPRGLDSNTLEAAAITVAQLANRIAPKPLAVEITRSLRRPADPILAVGLGRDIADLPLFEGKGPLVILRGDEEIQVRLRGQPMLQPNDGIVALMRNPVHDGRSILLIAANSASGLIRAARGAMRPHGPGSAAVIAELPAPRQPGRREWPAHLPPSESVTLADLGYTDLPLTSANGFSESLILNVTPDTRFMAQGHQLILKMRLNPDLYDPKSGIELQLNGERIGEYRTDQLSPRKAITLSMNLPARLLRLSNRVVIRWKGAATTVGTVAWIDRQTEVYMPRYYRAALPSLSLLRYHLYPFSLEPDLSSTIVVTPDRVDDSLMGAVLSLASALGRLSPAAYLRFRVKRHHELSARDLAESHLIFLHISTLMGPLERLLPDLRSAASVKLKDYPSIRELPSSWSHDKYVLVLTAADGLAMRSMIDQVFTGAVLDDLKGDTAYFEGSRNMYFTVQRSRPLHEFTYSVWINAWLRSNWFALPLVLATFSGLLFIALRVTLRRF